MRFSSLTEVRNEAAYLDYIITHAEETGLSEEEVRAAMRRLGVIRTFLLEKYEGS